jgi:hypothetical protein
MASSLTLSTQVGQNTVTAQIGSADDAAVQATILACARAMGMETAGKPAAEIARFWMAEMWRKTQSVARQQMERERLEIVRAEIEAEIGDLT